MLKKLIKNKEKGFSVVAIGAHPDDIELGCSGFLLKLKDLYEIKIYKVICSDGALRGSSKQRTAEQTHSDALMQVVKTFYLGLKDGELNHNSSLVKPIEEVLNEIQPKIVFTHSPNDYHQDHLAVARSTVSAMRRSQAMLISYPTYSPKEIFDANIYVNIESYFNRKLEILKCFESQLNGWYMDEEFIDLRAREAGIAIHAKYAEKFHLHFSEL